MEKSKSPNLIEMRIIKIEVFDFESVDFLVEVGFEFSDGKLQILEGPYPSPHARWHAGQFLQRFVLKSFQQFPKTYQSIKYVPNFNN